MDIVLPKNGLNVQYLRFYIICCFEILNSLFNVLYVCKKKHKIFILCQGEHSLLP